MPGMPSADVSVRLAWAEDAAGLRLWDGGVNPNSAEAVDLGKRLPAGKRHPLPHAERFDDAADWRADCHDIVNAAAALGCRDLGRGHAEQYEPLPRRARERVVARLTKRQIFLLRTAPFRHQHIGDRRAGADDVVGRKTIDALDEPAGKELLQKIADNAYERGVMIRTTGNLIILSPPLVIERKEVDEIVDVLAESIRLAAG